MSKRTRKDRGGYRIICTIDTIKEDEDIPEGSIVLETTSTIKHVHTSVHIDKRTAKFPDVDNVTIEPDKSVKIMIHEISSTDKSSIGALNITL